MQGIEMNETKIPGEFSYMDPIKFSDYKQEIIDAINSRQSYLGINEPTTLIDGFFSQPLQNEFTSDLIIGGPTIPMIMILGNNSGRIYYFALKVLLPDFNV